MLLALLHASLSCSVWEGKLADLRNRAAQEREGYEQEGSAKLQEAKAEWLAQLSRQQEANVRSLQAAEAALQATQDEWQKVRSSISSALSGPVLKTSNPMSSPTFAFWAQGNLHM